MNYKGEAELRADNGGYAFWSEENDRWFLAAMPQVWKRELPADGYIW